jgi:Cu(I)/Ag(I) efflux system membrane protein CusA/SilA
LTIVVPITLLTIVLLLFLNFRNLMAVLIILGTLPLASAGGFWLLYWLGYDLSVAVAVGFIALAGVAVELGVVMLIYLQQALEEERESLSDGGTLSLAALNRAVVNGALLRLRPIIMTVATIVLGLLPIMLGGGTGAELMKRIAAPMVGGMVSATLLTMAVIPAAFLLWQRWLLHRNGGTQGSANDS